MPRDICNTEGKVRHKTRKSCEEAATHQELKARDRNEILRLFVYRCGFCHDWHLTRTVRSGQRRREKTW